MPLIVYISTDNVIKVSGLRDAITDTYQNAAAVTVTMYDSADAEVVGETWPLALTYVPASNGDYIATLVDTLTLTTGEYTVEVIANAGAGLNRTWRAPVQVGYGS
jgi:hypothetical protein